MKQHKLIKAGVLGAVLALTLAGCATEGGGDGTGDNGGSESTTGEGEGEGGEGEGEGGDAPADAQQADFNPQPREALEQGGVVNFGINEIPAQLNHFNSDASADTARVAAWYMPQILLQEPDGTPYKHDAYLDEWTQEVVDGKTQLTFTFTEEATWNDGTPMDWTAIEATWIANRSSEEGFNPNATDGYKEIESVEPGETDKTAIVTFAGEFAWPQMPFLTGVIHPDVAEPDVFNEAFIDEPNPDWGAGPYKVNEFDAGSDTISFVPNELWWGDEPMLDEVTFTGLEASASINAFRNGEIDMVGTNTQDRLQQVADMEGVVTYRAQQTANSLLQVDAENPLFADLNVRKAFFLGLNIEQQKQIAWQGLDYTEEAAGSFTLYNFQPGWVDAFAEAGWSHNVEEANQLLDDAGWVVGDDGIREKDGERFSVVYPVFSDDPTQEALARSLQAQQAEIGIEVEIDSRSSQDFSNDYTTKNWDIVSLRFTSSDPFGAAWFCQLYCSDSGLNLSATGNEEIDARIHEELETISDAEEQTAKAMELEAEIVAETWGIFPLYNGPSIYTVKEGLANLTPEPYVGLDLFGVQPVENVGWMAEA